MKSSEFVPLFKESSHAKEGAPNVLFIVLDDTEDYLKKKNSDRMELKE